MTPHRKADLVTGALAYGVLAVVLALFLGCGGGLHLIDHPSGWNLACERLP